MCFAHEANVGSIPPLSDHVANCRNFACQSFPQPSQLALHQTHNSNKNRTYQHQLGLSRLNCSDILLNTSGQASAFRVAKARFNANLDSVHLRFSPSNSFKPPCKPSNEAMSWWMVQPQLMEVKSCGKYMVKKSCEHIKHHYCVYSTIAM